MSITCNQKRLLLVAQAFPPVGGSLVPRVVHLIKYLNLLGWKIHVLTIDVPKKYPNQDKYLFKRIPSEINVTRTRSGILRNFYLSSSSKRQKTVNSGSFCIKNRILYRTRRFLNLLLLPDTFAEWIPFAFWKGRKIVKKFKPNVILSMAVPFSAHLIGAMLAKEVNCIFVPDYADPWLYDSSRPRHSLRWFIEFFQEEYVLKQARAVSVVTDKTRDLYEEKWPFLKGRIEVIPLAFEPEDFHKQELPSNDAFVLTYTGRLLPENRNVLPFFQALASLRMSKYIPKILRIGFWGDFNPSISSYVHQLNLEDIVHINGWLNHKEFCLALLRSHGLLLFGNFNISQIPGKIFHYLGSGRPMLFISNYDMQDDPTTQYILNRPGTIFTKNIMDSIRQSLIKAFVEWKRFSNDDYLSLQLSAKDETWKVRADQMDFLLMRLLKNSRINHPDKYSV